MCPTKPLQTLTPDRKASPRIGTQADVACSDRVGASLLSACAYGDQTGKLAPNLAPIGLRETAFEPVQNDRAGETAMWEQRPQISAEIRRWQRLSSRALRLWITRRPTGSAAQISGSAAPNSGSAAPIYRNPGPKFRV